MALGANRRRTTRTGQWNIGYGHELDWDDNAWNEYRTPEDRGPTLHDLVPDFEAELGRAMGIADPSPSSPRPPRAPFQAARPQQPPQRLEAAFNPSGASSSDGPTRAAWDQWGQAQQQRARDAERHGPAAQRSHSHGPMDSQNASSRDRRGVLKRGLKIYRVTWVYMEALGFELVWKV